MAVLKTSRIRLIALVSDTGRSVIAWTGPNRILYAASSGVWSTDLTSGSSQLLVPGANQVVATADGRTIVYHLGRTEVWRADSDGTHASRLPDVMGGTFEIAPDGSALFYVSGQSGLQTAWKKDLRNGPPSQFVETRVAAGGIAVSPDSRWVALRGDEVRVVPIGGGAPMRRVAFPNLAADLRWTPNGEALAYLDATPHQYLDSADCRWSGARAHALYRPDDFRVRLVARWQTARAVAGREQQRHRPVDGIEERKQ